jgi:hypothetical protein
MTSMADTSSFEWFFVVPPDAAEVCLPPVGRIAEELYGTDERTF